MFQADGRTRAHGPLTVHVWGGGTWTSEFALLTGLNHDTFGEAGLYAPYNLAPRVVSTLPRVLHTAGYRVIAIYPMSGDFINARNAYKDYGFDKFYDGQDFGLSWESSDGDLMQVFDRIYAQEKQAIGKQPLFVMMLTLRQHGPHMTPLKDLPAPYDQPLFRGKFHPEGTRRLAELESGQLSLSSGRIGCGDLAYREDPARQRQASGSVSFRRSPAIVRRGHPRNAQDRPGQRHGQQLHHLLHAQDPISGPPATTVIRPWT